jgi:hypothetical protein
MQKLYRTILLTLALLLVASSAFLPVNNSRAAAQAQTLSPIQFLPGDEAAGPAAFNQEQPDIALGGSQYLAAWTDYRTGGSPLISDEDGADIFAARLDASGNLIDTTPIPLTLAPGEQTNPRVAWNGTNWLVIWLSQTPTQFFWSLEVQAVRLSPAGQVLDPAPITVYKFTSSTSAEAAVTSDGANWLVVTRGTQAGEDDVVGVRIASDGTLLDPSGVVLVPGTFSLTFNLDAAFAVDEYLLTYLFSGNVFALRLDTNLVPRDASPIRITNTTSSEESPRVASNGSDFFLAWDIYNSGTQTGSARATRFSYDGQVLDPGGISLSGNVFLGAHNPRTAWDGANWLTTFSNTQIAADPDELRAARVASDGTLLDPNGVVIEPVATFFDQVELTPASGGGAQLVWKDSRAGGEFPYDVSTFSLSQALLPGAPATISFGAPAQTEPDSAAAGDGFMTVFLSRISGQNRVMAEPLDADGNPLLPEPVMLASGPFLSEPAVAWNGSLYLAVWSDVDTSNLNNSLIYAQRIAADGSPVDPSPFAVMEGFTPDVAAAGDVFLIVDIQQTSSVQFREPFGARVQGSDGTILDPTPIGLGFSFAGRPAVAGLGNRWLMAYQRNFTHDDPHADIYANFVNADGTTSGSFVIATGLGPFFYDPDVASDGTDSLVIWEDNGAGDIGGAQVFSDGSIGSLINVSTAAEAQDNPAVAWDGTQYFSMYEDLRAITFFLDGRTDIFATRLDASGTVLDPDGFAAFNDLNAEIDPAVSGAGGVSLLAAAVFRPDAPDAAYRIGLRTNSETAQTGTLQGTVTDASNGNPISGALVDAGTGGSATTDANGFYQIANLPAGTYDVTASATGYDPSTVTGVVITAGTTTTQDFSLNPTAGCTVNCLRVSNIRMRLVSGGVGAQIVVVDENGSRVSGATVFTHWDLPGGATADVSATTNNTGRVLIRVRDSDPGTYTVTVTDIQKAGFTFDPAGSTILSKSITR